MWVALAVVVVVAAGMVVCDDGHRKGEIRRNRRGVDNNREGDKEGDSDSDDGR